MEEGAEQKTGKIVAVKGFWRWKQVCTFDNETMMKKSGFRKATPKEILCMAQAVIKRSSDITYSTSIRKNVLSLAEALPDSIKRKVSNQWEFGGLSKKSTQETYIEKAHQFADNSEEALQEAVTNGNLGRIKDLIAAGANPLIRDEQGRSLLHLAVSENNSEALTYLISIGLSVHAVDNEGNTLLHQAALKETDNKILAILQPHLKDKINDKNKAGDTALHLAFKVKTSMLLTLLMKWGADANIENTNGETVIHIAIGNNNAQAVLVLLKGGYVVDPTKYDLGGTPLHYLLRTNNADMLNELAQRRYADVISPLLHDLPDNRGNTPLHLALLMGNFQWANLLLGYINTNPMKMNNAGESPLSLAHNLMENTQDDAAKSVLNDLIIKMEEELNSY